MTDAHRSSSQTLYLASKSPRRRELLRQIGVPFQIVSVDVPEIHEPGEAPETYVARLAAAKARAGNRAVTLGADTIVVCDERVLEKPVDEADALAMLMQLSGRTHQVMSAVSLYTPARQLTRTSVTEVRFRVLSRAECSAYWRTGEPRDKAGGYAIQGLGAIFVASIQGSYSGVVGLPIEQTWALLKAFGLTWWQGDGG
ncbi:septum formation inhibitor Maf [Exilibacterium tricleocarpae]|uniref:dTTP/UTP pyrophosphatase n=1 Tax=Exilibacterium tricleocarpae TaxID=2591008 RepID=A0A545TSH0_9GAMM|nr:Maf family protein [Exilibacterium tricleocarpae]TQV80162.1 septum formation inhibitor Maf [Exilibacterium tricleocarpae]